MKRTLSLFTLNVFFIATLGGCGKKEDSAGNSSGLSTKNNVIYWFLSDATKLIPYISHDQQASYVYQLLWEPLNLVNQRTQDLEPWIASLPEISADHKVYTYT